VQTVRVLIATAGLLAVAGAAAAAVVPHAQTLRRSPGPVDAITQDGPVVAWIADGGTKCNVVHAIGPGWSESMPQPSTASMTCHWDLSAGQPQLAFAAGVSSALWTLHEGGSVPYDYLMTAHAKGPEVIVDRLGHASDGTGWWVGGIAGAGTTLAYSAVDVEYVDKLGCLSGAPCKKKIAGGAIHTISDGQEAILPGTPPALELAAASDLIAYAPAMTVAKDGSPAPNRSAAIQVVDVEKGTVVSQVVPNGLPLAIALAPNVLAVLTSTARAERVSWYAIGSGTKLGSAGVPLSTAPELAVGNRMVVYRVGSVLRGIDLVTGRVRTLTRASIKPVGFSLAGNRLVWAENTPAGGRIRALQIR